MFYYTDLLVWGTQLWQRSLPMKWVCNSEQLQDLRESGPGIWLQYFHHLNPEMFCLLMRYTDFHVLLKKYYIQLWKTFSLILLLVLVRAPDLFVLIYRHLHW